MSTSVSSDGVYYVNNGAGITCTFAMPPAVQRLSVLPDKMTNLENHPAANITDCKTMVNIPLFGTCSAKPLPSGGFAPCTPACVSWMPGKVNVFVANKPALVTLDTAICSAGGGTITITSPG